MWAPEKKSARGRRGWWRDLAGRGRRRDAIWRGSDDATRENCARREEARRRAREGGGSSGSTRCYPGLPNGVYMRSSRLEPGEDIESGGGNDFLTFTFSLQ
jgi:hypothetical protein